MAVSLLCYYSSFSVEHRVFTEVPRPLRSVSPPAGHVHDLKLIDHELSPEHADGLELSDQDLSPEHADVLSSVTRICPRVTRLVLSPGHANGLELSDQDLSQGQADCIELSDRIFSQVMRIVLSSVTGSFPRSRRWPLAR